MDKKQFIKNWKNFLIDIDKTLTDIATENNQSQPNLSKKINNATIKYIELSEIVEKYGYTIEIRKKE